MFRRQAQQKAFRTYLAALLNERYRDRVARLVTNQSNGHYSGLRHFLRHAPWNAEALNEIRIAAMYSCRQTRPQRGFTLIVDDSSQPDSAAVASDIERQHVHHENIKTRGVLYATHLFDGVRNFPLDLIVAEYPPLESSTDFRASEEVRPELVLKLVDRCMERKHRPGAVVLNKPYSMDVGFLAALRSRELNYVGALSSTSQVACYLPGQSELKHGLLRDIVSQIPPLMWVPLQEVARAPTVAETGPRWTTTLQFVLNGTDDKHWGLISLNAPIPAAATEITYLMTNCATRAFSPEWMWATYTQRDRVREFYHAARSLLNLSEYRFDSVRSLTRHWMLLYVAYSFIVWHRLTGSLQRQTHRKIHSFSEAIDAYRSILQPIPVGSNPFASALISPSSAPLSDRTG
ncbi:MAG: transposase [Cyanobacteria bacterium P01_F01_bin.33]